MLGWEGTQEIRMHLENDSEDSHEPVWDRGQILRWLRERVWLDLEEAHEWMSSHRDEIFRKAIRFTNEEIEEYESEASSVALLCLFGSNIAHEWLGETERSSIGDHGGPRRADAQGEP